MAPAGWCNPEQCVWFANRLANFHQARLENTVGAFLAAAVKEFMALWPLPECAEEIIGNTLEDIAKRAQQDVHYQKRKKQIEARFNNNRGKAHAAAIRNASGKTLSSSPKKKKILYSLRPAHRLRAVQIYSQRYYKKCVQAAIKKAIRQSLNPLTCGQKLSIINKLTFDAFQSESEDVKTEVFDALEQLREERAEALEKGLQSPEDYLDAIDAAPAMLNRFLSDLAVQTGWWFTVIAGGPDPADGGNIRTGSFHVGSNGHKRNFQDEFIHHSVDPNDSTTCRMTFEEGVIAPYGRFLKTLFSPEVRAQRACNQADMDALNETLNDDEDDELEATPGMSGLLSMPNSPPSPPLPLFQPASTPTPCTPNAGPISPSIPSFEPPLSTTSTAAGLVSPPIASFHPDLMLQPSESCEELGREDWDPQLFWQDARFGHDYFSMSATERDRLAYDNLLGCAVLDHKGEGESFPFTGAISGEGQVDLGISGDHYPDLQAELEGSPLPLLPSHDRDHTDVHELDADLPSRSSVPRTPPSRQFDGELTPVRMRRKRHNRVVDGNEQRQDESATVVDGSEGDAGEDLERRTSKRQQEESAAVDEDAGEEHERRTSKRARRLPASRALVAVGWLPSAVQYLTDSNLGPEWADLLAAWQVLEAQISQNGSPTKGRLGTITSRPSSLSVWLQNRRYNVYPQLPPSFSAEFLAWWNALQPNWRRSETGPLPAANYSRSLHKALSKGGQNGLVTVLIGLMWWGQGSLSAEEHTLWNAAVADVYACIRTLLPPLTVTD
ncbi:hypothetical protein IW261DRAFT_1565606 [Armillaria novae-zelandiae]|uniref:Uncharacterized protein n=2 Tax=Armillaria TaxID=47424 RepID=A0AA39TBD5_9AGAR|nr:hypothetical protein IW261DRAFT_1565606 [Armillaria novae-zelandiae]